MSAPTVDDPAMAGGERARFSTRVQRVLTGIVAAPLALAIVFFAPEVVVLAACVLAFGGAAVEYVRLVRHWAPSAPLGLVPMGAAGAAIGLYSLLTSSRGGDASFAVVPWLIGGSAALVGLCGLVTLFSAVRMPEAMIGLGLIHFGIPFFALPMICMVVLAASDPWLLTLLLLAIWAGDTAAYFFGSRFGRHRLAPVVSPNKTWEGAAAGLAASVAVGVVWCLLRLGEIDLRLVAMTAAAGVAGQLGDLLESMIKRGVGAKDSSRLLPGHGGLFDRLDALIIAGPVFVSGLWLVARDYLTALTGTPHSLMP